MDTISRYSDGISVQIANLGTKTPGVSLNGFAGGSFGIPAGWTGGASVSFEAANGPSGTFLPVYDKTNTVVSITVTAGRNYPLPDEVCRALRFKIVAAGAVSRDETIELSLKG